jgi:hypothetical protein
MDTTQQGAPSTGAPVNYDEGATVNPDFKAPAPAATNYDEGATANPDYKAPSSAPQTGMQKVTSGLEAQTGSDWDSPVLGNTISGAVKSAAGGLGNVLDMLNHKFSSNSQLNNPQTVGEKTRAQALADSYKQAHPTATPQEVSQYMNEQASKGVSSHVQDAADWLRSSGQPTGFWQNVGSLGEQALELLGTDGISKLATVPVKAGEAVQAIDSVQHAAQTAKIVKVLKDNPRLAGLVTVGLKASKDAVTMGAQSYAHTEDTGQAVTAGLTGGAVGGALGVVGNELRLGAKAADTVDNFRNVAENAPTGNEVEHQLGNSVTGAVQPTIDAAQSAQNEAEEKIANASTVPETLAQNAPSNEAITSATQKAVKGAHDSLMTEYGKGLEALKGAAQGQTLSLEGSPLQKAAATLLGKGEAEGRTLDIAFDKSNPGSDKANKMLRYLENPYADEQEAAAKAKATVGPQPADTPVVPAKTLATDPVNMDMKELVDRRKQLGEKLRDTGWQSDEQRSDRGIYKTLLQGTDDSIQQLLNQSGNPEAIDTLNNMNSKYRTGIQRFDNPDVRALLEGNSNDVAKRLMGGGTSVDDINTVRDTIGKDAFQKLSDDSLQRFAADSVDKKTGQLDFNTFFKKWNTIPAATRQAMFQDSFKAGTLQQAMMQVQKTNASGVIPEAAQTIKDATNQIAGLLKSGDVGSLLKDPDRVQAIHALVGPRAMGELGTSIMQNQIREASTDATGKVGNVNAGKVLDFIKSLKDSPEVVNALFKPTPETAAAYDKVMSDLKSVKSTQSLMKAGIMLPTLGAGAGVGHAMGSVLLGTVVAGLGEKMGADFIDKIANSPAAWTTIKALNTAGQSTMAHVAARGAQVLSSHGATGLLNAGKPAWAQSAQSSLSK